MALRAFVFAVAVLLGVGLSCADVATIDVEPVWSGHPVGFALLTHPPHQFAAYYDAERRMSVAHRRLGEPKWTVTRLPSKIGWDSHNYITMVVDREGYLHLSGNMHCVPLIYFRSDKPLDASTLKRVPNMVDPKLERRVTYPIFIWGPTGELIFRYRDGGSGNGNDHYNVYDEKSRTWRRLIDTPLTSGEGKMNAYCTRPTKGPDGRYHMVWVWRDTPDCATNHDLSYARSRDLVNWESGDGRKLTLPITIGQGSVVDPVPAGGGIINGGHKLGFDSKQRPIITYHKYDEDGWTQPHAARLEDGRWHIEKIADWQGYRWSFEGGGAIGSEVRVGTPRVVGGGHIQVEWRRGDKRGVTVIDGIALKPIVMSPEDKPRAPRPEPLSRSNPDRVEKPSFPGLFPRSAGDSGSSGEPNVRYHLTWWTQKHNRDRRIEGPVPPPVMLRLVKTQR